MLFLSPMLQSSQEVSLVLYPSTAEDSVSQFVRLTLKLTLDQQVSSHSYNMVRLLYPVHLKQSHLILCAYYYWISTWLSTASDHKWTRSEANYTSSVLMLVSVAGFPECQICCYVPDQRACY